MKIQAIGTDKRRLHAAALGGADWLGLAATPTFALMALVTAVSGNSSMDMEMLCASAQHASSLNGMSLMYLLMSAFHIAPWLRRAARLSRGAVRQNADLA